MTCTDRPILFGARDQACSSSFDVRSLRCGLRASVLDPGLLLLLLERLRERPLRMFTTAGCCDILLGARRVLSTALLSCGRYCGLFSHKGQPP